MRIDLNLPAIAAMDLERFRAHVPPDYQEYFWKPPGQEHYRLLAYLSTLFSGVTIVDVGTDAGCSAMALSSNLTSRVVSFDIVNRRRCDIQLPNVEFRIQDALSDQPLLLGSPLVLLDTAHEGPYEHAFYHALSERGYKGLLVVDDLYLNDAMKDFWESISHPKYDLSSVGHWSGTGIVVF